jgi:nitroreductase
MDFVDQLIARRSAPALLLGTPVPSEADLARVFRAAMAAPDHGGLKPWRFIIVRGDARAKLGQVMADAQKKKDPATDADGLEREKNKPMRSAMIIAVAVAIDPENKKIPAQEQVVSGACAAHSMMLAFQALGYGSVMLTGPAAYNADVKAALGLKATDAVVAYVYVGTPKGELPAARPRPDYSQFVREWTGPESVTKAAE